MSLFSFDPTQTLTELAPANASPMPRSRGASEGGGLIDLRGRNFTRDNGTVASRDDLADQFIAYQISKAAEGPALLDTSAVQPGLAGSAEQPDVLARMNLISFHIGKGEGHRRRHPCHATHHLRRRPSSSTRMLDTAFWAVAAGLKLYQDGKVAQDKQLAADLNRAFANRPVEIAGGLGLLSFEVVRHEEPVVAAAVRLCAWPHRPDAHQRARFPAITQPALSLVDELLGRLADDPHEVLFKSAPMRLALSRRAHDNFTGGNARIKLGALDDGYCVLARGRDHDTLVAADPVFHPTHGILAPASANPARIEELTTDNPCTA